jgi:hypothetical protein
MSNRSRSRWLAGGGALLLVLSLSGVAAAHSLVADTNQPPSGVVDPAPVVDATLTFQDTDGNGVDDRCQTDVIPNADAVLAAVTAADLDGNGTISTSEAAQSDWTGGTNCNHGGYVSGVAKSTADTCDEGGATTPTATTITTTATTDGATEATEDAQQATTETECDKTADQAVDQPPAACPVIVVPVAPVVGTTTPDAAPNAHGLAVSTVAQSDAVGGKNCNHGGAVSEAAKVHGASDQNAAKSGHPDRISKPHGKGHGHGHAG